MKSREDSSKDNRWLWIKCRTSEIQLVDIPEQSSLYESLMQLPSSLCVAKQYGISLKTRFYNGQLRNPQYIENRIKAHFRAVELNRFKGKQVRKVWNDQTVEILRILAHARGFITYDKLNEILASKGRSWRVITAMKGKEREDLAKYPTYSEEQERFIEKQVAEEEEEKQRVKAHEEAFKKRKFIKDLEETIEFQKNQLRDYEDRNSMNRGDWNTTSMADYYRQILETNQDRLTKAKKELEENQI